MLIDVVRGIAITLVVFGHSNQGVQHRGWWGQSLTGLRLTAAIYAFHMPTFFFVSGIFLAASVSKRGVPRFIRDKLRTMIWPYLVFAILGYGVMHVVGRFTIQKPAPLREFVGLVASGAISWFLPTIFFTVMIGMLGRKLPKPLFLLVAVALSNWLPAVPVLFIADGIKFLPFLVLGMWVSSGYKKFESLRPGFAAAGAVALAAAIGWLTSSLAPRISWRFLGLGTLGIVMLLLAARVLGKGHIARTISWIGEASFGIFLISPYVQGFARELILRITHSVNPWLQSIGETLLAVTIPALLYQYRRRLHIGWMFIYPLGGEKETGQDGRQCVRLPSNRDARAKAGILWDGESWRSRLFLGRKACLTLWVALHQAHFCSWTSRDEPIPLDAPQRLLNPIVNSPLNVSDLINKVTKSD